METLEFENQWCRIVKMDDHFVLQSKSKKYDDKYFISLTDAKKAGGIVDDSTRSFIKKLNYRGRIGF